MKKLFILAIAAVGLLACNGKNEPVVKNGALLGKFSVSESKQVQFSQGNLQYQASTQTWRFAAKQYDVIGNDNSNISSSYSGWRDLFGWGTGNNPTLSSEDSNDYSTFVDWSINAISNTGNEANLWRTLTKDEWEYLFNNRAEASSKYGKASVAGVNGIIILPDVYKGKAINTDHNAWSNNTISSSEWTSFESAGAVFLPAAGHRWGTDVHFAGSDGLYWSSTPYDEDYAYILSSDSIGLSPRGYAGRYGGLSVRLVKDVQ